MSNRHYLCLLGIGLLTAGCAQSTPRACPAATSVRAAHVLFATDREKDEPAKKGAEHSLDYGPGRTQPPSLQLGWQTVEIAPKHRLGVLDAAVTLAPAEVKRSTQGTPAREALHRTDEEIISFASHTVRAAIRASPPPPAGARRQVLLYIHGYNDTFNYAIRKTAQLAADLDLVTCSGESRGVPIAYSWPARGTFLGYLADEENAEWTQQRLVPFLKSLSAVAREEGADLHIVAHSMGCRLLVRSLAEVATSQCAKPSRPLVSQVILLAPDIGRELFNEYAERMLPLVGHLTVYVSAKDRALSLSSLVHGGHQRLGLIESTISAALKLTGSALSLAGLPSSNYRELSDVTEQEAKSGKFDMIDVSGGLTDFVGHSYEDPAFIHDLHELIYHHTPAGEGGRSNLREAHVRPGLLGLTGESLKYYEMNKSR